MQTAQPLKGFECATEARSMQPVHAYEPDDPAPPKPEPTRDPGDVRSMRVLIADDAPFNVALLSRLLADWGFDDVRSTTDSSDLESLVESYRPDIIMLDLQMPAPDGFELTHRLRARETDTPVPILMLTADTTIETRRRALALGVSDFLSKPFDHEEVCLRASNLLRTRQLELRLAEQNAELEAFATRRTVALEEARIDMLRHLARVAEHRDDDTQQHNGRVARSAAALGEILGLAPDALELLQYAAELHDIGKVAIPDSILLKPGKLTPEEFDVMKTHTTAGAAMLADSASPHLQMAATIALSHHERWDGNGYPHGLSGRAIPVEARIVMVADVFDALTHERPYKDAMDVPDAITLMRDQTGSFFDPWVMAGFEHLDHEQAARG